MVKAEATIDNRPMTQAAPRNSGVKRLRDKVGDSEHCDTKIAREDEIVEDSQPKIDDQVGFEFNDKRATPIDDVLRQLDYETTNHFIWFMVRLFNIYFHYFKIEN